MVTLDRLEIYRIYRNIAPSTRLNSVKIHSKDLEDFSNRHIDLPNAN